MSKPGRPRIIKSPEAMDRLVEEYVATCREEGEPLTLTGMILHLGLSSRQSFDRYGERPEFTDSVKRAKLLIENEYERKLDRARPAGAIFALKNMGWSDAQEVAFKGALANLDLNQLPNELIERIAEGENILSVLASAAERGLTRDGLLRLPRVEEEEGEEGAAE